MFIQWIKDFLLSNRTLMIVIASGSLVSLLASLILIPVLIIKIPNDYFIISHKEYVRSRVKHPVLRFIVHLLKNSFGVVFIISGFIMLFIPGQGLITLLIGVSLLDFPCKRKLEYKLISRPAIYKVINIIRHKAKKETLRLA